MISWIGLPRPMALFCLVSLAWGSGSRWNYQVPSPAHLDDDLVKRKGAEKDMVHGCTTLGLWPFLAIFCDMWYFSPGFGDHHEHYLKL